MSGNAYHPAALLPALRLAGMLAALSVLLVVGAFALGLIPDRHALLGAERARTVNLLTWTGRQLIATAQEPALADLLAHVVDSGLVRGIYARHADGSLLAVEGAVDLDRRAGPADPDFALIEMTVNGRNWGQLGVVFPPVGNGLPGPLSHPLCVLILLLGGASLVLFTLYLRRVLATQDPASVMPERVRTVMNGLVEGVVLLDANGNVEQIMQPALDALREAGVPVRTVAAAAGRCNKKAQIARWLGDQDLGFAGVQLTSGMHCDAEDDKADLTCRLLCGGAVDPRNAAVLRALVVGWVRGWIAGQDDADLLPGGRRLQVWQDLDVIQLID